MQPIYSRKPPPFYMYNLAKLEACSEPCQIPKVELFPITVCNGFNSLTVSAENSTSLTVSAESSTSLTVSAESSTLDA